MNRPLDLAPLARANDSRSRVERLADGAVVVLEAAGIVLALSAMVTMAAVAFLILVAP